MTAWNWCPECSSMHAPGSHLPLWRVCDVDLLDDEFDSYVQIRAVDPEQAAERWAEQDDAGGDYDIAGRNHEPTVVVQDALGCEVGRYVVSGEAVPQYHAKRAE